MAIRLVTGVPGSGKSYFMVNHLVENYCVKNDGVITLKGDVEIVTNIDELKLPTTELDVLMHKFGGAKYFFTLPVQEKITQEYKEQGKSILYILDEAQQYFDRKFYEKEVFYYFQKHRHLGHDVYLLTQHESLISKDIFQLCECHYRALPRSKCLGGRFNYLQMMNGQMVNRKLVAKKQEIFDLYKSFDMKETEKIKNPFTKMFLMVGILFLIGGGWTYHRFSQWGKPDPVQPAPPISAVSGPVRSVSTGPASAIGQRVIEQAGFGVSETVLKVPDAPALPDILDYEPRFDLVKFRVSEEREPVFLPVSAFIDQFPPSLCGYAYFHCPKSFFRIYSPDMSYSFFPVERWVYAKVGDSQKEKTLSDSEDSLSVSSHSEDLKRYIELKERCFIDRHGNPYDTLSPSEKIELTVLQRLLGV